MDVFLYLSEHHDQLFYLLAGLCFIIELTVIGLSGPLLFFAIACLFTGILICTGVITGWEYEILTVGISAAVITVFLWQPLKNLQNAGGGPDSSSDMIGQQVVTSSEITLTRGKIRYSGIDWDARLAKDAQVNSIANDSFCVIAAVEGNTMLVKPISTT